MGEWDFMLRVVTRDIKAFEAFYLDHLSKLPYVQAINSSVDSHGDQGDDGAADRLSRRIW